MLKTEAEWLGNRLVHWPTDRGVVLNIGSSSGAFRSEVQPWIEQRIFAPAGARGLRVVHQDLFAADGVDVAGDLFDPAIQTRLRALNVFGVVCSNVLEHVVDRQGFANILAGLLPPGGRALVTVPHRFPYHPDPIDTLFRPGVAELRALFPELNERGSDLLRCGRLLDLALAQPGRIVRKKPADPGVKQPERALRDWLPYLVRSFKMACVELERPGA